MKFFFVKDDDVKRKKMKMTSKKTKDKARRTHDRMTIMKPAVKYRHLTLKAIIMGVKSATHERASSHNRFPLTRRSLLLFFDAQRME